MEAQNRAPKHFIQALARGLGILQAFSAQRPRLTLTDLSQATGLNKAAVQRLTDTLLALGFLGRNRHKEFYLGPQVLSLGYAYLQGSELRDLAKDHLRRLAQETGHTVSLCVLDGVHVVVVYRHEVDWFLKLDVQVGSRLPCHCTSMGKLLLAALPDQELKVRLKGLKLASFTPYTITDRKALWTELMATRQRGYAQSDREAPMALYSLAAPLIDRRERVVAAASLSLFAEQADEGTRQRLTERLLAEGRRLSGLLGYTGPYPALPLGLADNDD